MESGVDTIMLAGFPWDMLFASTLAAVATTAAVADAAATARATAGVGCCC